MTSSNTGSIWIGEGCGPEEYDPITGRRRRREYCEHTGEYTEEFEGDVWRGTGFWGTTPPDDTIPKVFPTITFLSSPPPKQRGRIMRFLFGPGKQEKDPKIASPTFLQSPLQASAAASLAIPGSSGAPSAAANPFSFSAEHPPGAMKEIEEGIKAHQAAPKPVADPAGKTSYEGHSDQFIEELRKFAIANPITPPPNMLGGERRLTPTAMRNAQPRPAYVTRPKKEPFFDNYFWTGFGLVASLGALFLLGSKAFAAPPTPADVSERPGHKAQMSLPGQTNPLTQAACPFSQGPG